MESYLLKDEEFNRLFNCNTYNPDTIKIEVRTHKTAAYSFLFAYFIVMLAYTPFFYSIFFAKRQYKLTYKLIMMYVTVQMLGIQFAGPITVFLAVRGIVFCYVPNIDYIISCFAWSVWTLPSTMSVILGINRLCEQQSSSLAFKVFGGRRGLTWLAVPIFYALFIFFFMPPFAFNSHFIGYLLNPHEGYAEVVFDSDGHYTNRMFLFHNAFIVFLELIVYILTLILYLRVSRFAKKDELHRLKSEKQIYIQILFFRLGNVVTCTIYFVYYFIPVTFVTSLVFTYIKLAAPTLTSLAYFVVSRTVKNTSKIEIVPPKNPENPDDPVDNFDCLSATSHELQIVSSLPPPPPIASTSNYRNYEVYDGPRDRESIKVENIE
ncbi:hypothetical protein M3Y97_01089200 [Aphelenchoides bicaudatus]|nr:hypothetical protein M3Y97_01089200 [Aphelenchoides bicaudatus]